MKLTQQETLHYDVTWYGPYEYDPENDVDLPGIHENNVLYMICGTHGLYGKNVPLYIGKTIQGVNSRIPQHSWIAEEPDPVKVYTACIGEFISWDHNSKIDAYPPLSNSIITQIEALLIYVHQPVYNRQAKQGNIRFDSHISVFNTGRRSTLYPEISTRRWIGDQVLSAQEPSLSIEPKQEQ
jgi:hypothetical protein